MWSGTFVGDISGTWGATYEHIGANLTGTATIHIGPTSVPTSVGGTVVCNHIIVGFVTFATFDGTVVANQGQTCASGTWAAAGGVATGTWDGCK